MQITSVTYGELRNLGNYQNQRLSAHAQVGEGETAEEATAKLKAWIQQQLDLDERSRYETRDLQRRVDDLTYEADRLEKRVESAKTRWEQASAFLKAHGLAAERAPWEDWDRASDSDDDEREDPGGNLPL